MERSFSEEVKRLSLGHGETFHGDGILAVTKALPQSGVSDIGGYRGAPVSHRIDVRGNRVKGYGESSERGHRNLKMILSDVERDARAAASIKGQCRSSPQMWFAW